MVPITFDVDGDGTTDVDIVKASGGYRDKKGEILTVSLFFKDTAGNRWNFLEVPASSTDYEGRRDTDGFTVHVHACGDLEPGKGKGNQKPIGPLGPAALETSNTGLLQSDSEPPSRPAIHLYCDM